MTLHEYICVAILTVFRNCLLNV